jgi:uncharacterized membrane protein YeaQ/YmgE (transglycosylase-associated protein family)
VLILFILVWGFLVGWIAQLIVFRTGGFSALTLGAGLAGSFVGGLVVSLIAGDGVKLRPSGLIGSIVGAIIVLLLVKVARRD